MGNYRNEKPQVVVVSGKVIKPKQVIDLDDDSVGLARLVKRKVLSKVDARTKEGKAAAASDKSNSGNDANE